MTKKDRKKESGERRKSSRIRDLFGFYQLSEKRQRLLLIFLLASCLTLIIIPKGGFVPDHYAPGDIASRDIKSPRDMLVEDEPLTEKKRLEAENETRPLYDYDTLAGREASRQLGVGLERLAKKQLELEPPSQESLQSILQEALGTSVTAEQVRKVLRLGLDDLPLGEIEREMGGALSRPIVGNLKLFQTESTNGIVMRSLAGGQEIPLDKLEQVVGIGRALDLVQERWTKLGLNPEERNVLRDLAQPLIRPNLTFNRNETEERRFQARESVPPVLFQIKKGEMIVREGERVTPSQIVKLRALRDLGKEFRQQLNAFGLLVATLVLFFVGHTFARINIRKFKPDNRDLVFLASSYVGLFLLIKVSILISSALGAAIPAIDASTYYYLIPFAMGSMLVRLVLNSEIALMFAIIGALLVGVLFGNNLSLTMYVLAGSLIGAHGVRHCKERTTLYQAGLKVAAVNLVMIIAIHFLAGKAVEMQLLYKLAFGFFGGILSAVFVNGTVPLIESLFKYTTDVKLLEMANLNSPVLRELMIQAPGTYHHSIVVGNLVESAAEAINANPLLSRVAAYYHDIGKIRKPLYFIENAEGQSNKHDKLAPSMSALILTSHVKDGIEMAREAKLGKELIDIIQQHHGTSLIKFFYDKAMNQAKPGMHQIKEDDYRYPGPKPQTREAALIMLADAVEAASRTLSDPTPARIQGMVQKIINNIFIDGQLDECELTLKDLHQIARSFNRILSGIFHNRIDYPEPAFKEREKEGGGRKKENDVDTETERAPEPVVLENGRKKDTNDSDREPTGDSRDRNSSTDESGADDLKRLGMS